MKYNGIRIILIYSLTRNKLIEFIKRNDKSYKMASFRWHSDDQLREIAILKDKKRHEVRQNKYTNNKKSINQL